MKKAWLAVLAMVMMAACGATGGSQGGATTAKSDGSAVSGLFGTRLTDASRNAVPAERLGGKLVGIYFSAHWCGPCRQFTPVLVDTYRKLKARGKAFEIVFVSSDTSEENMYGYMRETGMPWLAVPWKGDVANALKQKYGVTGIPTFIVVDADGKTVSQSARSQVASRGVGAWDLWTKVR